MPLACVSTTQLFHVRQPLRLLVHSPLAAALPISVARHPRRNGGGTLTRLTTMMGIQDIWLILCFGHDSYARPKVELEAQYLPALLSVVRVRASPTPCGAFLQTIINITICCLSSIVSRSYSTPSTTSSRRTTTSLWFRVSLACANTPASLPRLSPLDDLPHD